VDLQLAYTVVGTAGIKTQHVYDAVWIRDIDHEKRGGKNTRGLRSMDMEKSGENQLDHTNERV